MAATAASPTGRLRRGLDRALPRTPQGFAAVATAVVVVMWVNVASGALVRVTGSGLGCPDWPGCHGRPVPPMAGHALIEFSNRLIALTGIVLALVAFAAARRAGADRRNRRIALAIALLMLAQAPLGALTVLFDLNPLLVISHFLVAVVVVALSAVLWQRADLAARPVERPREQPGWLGPLALGTAIAGFGLIVTGAFTTAAGPHAGGEDIRRLGELTDAAYIHVRAAIAFLVIAGVLLLALMNPDRRPAGSSRLMIAVAILVPLQIAIGEWQWRHELPWGFVLAHVSVAAALWIATVGLATRTLATR